MKNINNRKQKSEQVEVMALFNYSQTPCQPLYFKEKTGREVEITELLRAQVKFVGDSARHVFNCLSGKKNYQLEFDSHTLIWHLIS